MRTSQALNDAPDGVQPLWARWNGHPQWRYTIGVEEELMLLHRTPDHSPAPSGDRVLSRLSRELLEHTSPETHASVIELATGIHRDVAAAAAQLTTLRAQLAQELTEMDLCAVCAGTYPLARTDEIRVSGGARYGRVTASMRMLTRREPTMALHVHVGVPEPEDAVRLLNGLREVVPVLLALSANSPFSQGRDSGFASARTVIFQGFPRTGTPRRFADYADYVEAVDPLIASGALPPTSRPASGIASGRASGIISSISKEAHVHVRFARVRQGSREPAEAHGRSPGTRDS
jgi:glutamate---cysteine ligase / carboxylate-amine ligase